jgi:hypothetical protein
VLPLPQSGEELKLKLKLKSSFLCVQRARRWRGRQTFPIESRFALLCFDEKFMSRLAAQSKLRKMVFQELFFWLIEVELKG